MVGVLVEYRIYILEHYRNFVFPNKPKGNLEYMVHTIGLIDVFLQVHKQSIAGRMLLQCTHVTGSKVVVVSVV